MSFITAGEASKPAVLLLHGFPSSARMFREVVPELSQAAYLIAPDLPGFGESDVLPAVSFPAFGQAISELLDRLAIGPRYVYAQPHADGVRRRHTQSRYYTRGTIPRGCMTCHTTVGDFLC